MLITTDPAMAEKGRRECIFLSYAALPKRATVGMTVFMDDGNVELRVESVNASAGTLTCVSLTDAPIGEKKNVNLPGLEVDLPAVTAKDEIDIATARAAGADFIFASFVQSAAAVRHIRSLCGPGIKIVSKIESQAGIDRYDEILSASDGIMIAR